MISVTFQSNFVEFTLRHGCSPVNLLHIFRTPVSKNTLFEFWCGSPNISNNWLNEFQSDWILQFSGILIITKISNCWIVTSSTNVCCYWSNSLHHLGKIFQNKIQQTPGSNKNLRICLIDKTVIRNLKFSCTNSFFWTKGIWANCFT